jgi:plasmid stabilization system protein ParE
VTTPQICWTAPAEQDVTDIWFYIAAENSTTVADAMLTRISAALDRLAFAPMIGMRRGDLTGAPRGFVVRPYTIIYQPLPKRDGILVWRILHGARDLRFIVKPPSADEP